MADEKRPDLYPSTSDPYSKPASGDVYKYTPTPTPDVKQPTAPKVVDKPEKHEKAVTHHEKAVAHEKHAVADKHEKLVAESRALTPEDGVPQHLMGVSLDEVFRYGRIISAIISAIKAVSSLALGVSEKQGLVQFSAHGKDYDWDLGTITRTK